MSFDLYFTPKESLPTSDQLEAYLEVRANYGVEDGRAWYENEDTGVYFSLQLSTGEADEEEDEEDEGERGPSVVFNMNYFRPSFFALEAALELEAFVNHFGLQVDDPQVEGMGNGPFTREGFLRGWNAGNHFACSALLSMQSIEDVSVYPADGLRRIWEWNYHRNDRKAEAGECVFIPKIMFLPGQQRARTAIVWPGGCPIYMPKVDCLLIYRGTEEVDNLQGERELVLATWDQAEELLSQFTEVKDSSVPYLDMDYDFPEDDILEFIASLDVLEKQHLILDNDRVLDEELINEVRRQAE